MLLPQLLMPAQTEINAADLAFADFLADEEKTRQRAIVKARNYHFGEQFSFLTKRLKEFLDLQNDELTFRLNVCRPVVTAVTERLGVIGLDAIGAAEEQSDGTFVNPQAAWAWELWQANRMDGKQDAVHEGATRDGEYFVIVDWDQDNARPRFTPQQRYTDAEVDGDGEGCRAFYANDDPNQELLYVAKRWTELFADESGRTKSRQRMTLYFPDRVEKYFLNRGAWELFDGDGDGGIVEWVDRAGKPLGIAAAHFKNKDLLPEAREAYSPQDGINKSYIDFLACMDTAGLRILYTLGFVPTDDGKPLAADQSNAMRVTAGMLVSTSKSAQEAAFGAIEPTDPTKLLDAIDRQILYVAILTDTPVNRFTFTRQVAAEGTLKEQSEPLLAKVEKKQINLGNGWEDVFTLARKLSNARGVTSFDEAPRFQTQWKEIRARTTDEQKTEADAKKASGVPLEQIWREVWGYDEKTIAQMKQSDEFQARLTLLNSAMQMGAPDAQGNANNDG